MKIKKPTFWDYKQPNFLSYLLLPFSLPIIINNLFLDLKKNEKKNQATKNICVGNIYIGGTAKTPLSIKIDQILKDLNFKTATIKKFYKDQADEQKILSKKTKLYCFKTRQKALNEAIKDEVEVAIFDDGLQDRSINYDLKFVCFNNITWIGNGLLIPAGPLREKLKSILKYDAIFLNGNDENTSKLKLEIRKYNKKIEIFETYYRPINIKEFDKNEKYLIFSGIGNPDSFKKTLIKNKLHIIKEFKFPDHHKYTFKDINKIKLAAKTLNAKILTTEKDYVKLPNDVDIKFLEIELAIKQENRLINFLRLNI
jgi:tetraacyldisaccharide 4'-kinase|tara:strand:- start:5825 stop:6760 length:936 start_codon:yes stop_codon:yes gene_type:complete